MSDTDNLDTPSEETTVIQNEGQPPVDPKGDDLPGMTEPTEKIDPNVREEKESLYQTKYQETLKKMEEQDAQLMAYENQFGAPPEKQPEPATPQEVNVEEYDLYSAEGQNALRQSIIDGVKAEIGGINQGVKDTISKARTEERNQAQADAALGGFNKWAADNQIPDDVVKAAWANFDRQFKSPHAATAAVMKIINSNYGEQATEKEKARLIAEATKKAKSLESQVVTPEGTAPLSPGQQGTSNIVTGKFAKAGQSSFDKL